MEVIYPNSITAATASEHASGFPASRLEDDHPKKYWKAENTAATITLTVSGGSDSLALFNMYIDDITITIKNEAETETLWGPESYNLKGIDTLFELMTDAGDRFLSFWIDYDIQRSAHKIIISCTVATGDLYAGVIQAGPAKSFPDPEKNLSEGQKDYSIVKELSSGSVYTRKRDVVNTYNGALWLERDTEFYTFMRTIAKANGPNPLAWKVASNIDHHMYTVFARFETPPQSSFGLISHKSVNFSLIEVV